MNNILDAGLAGVKAMMAKKGYTIFTDGKPNIVGIRNANKDTDDSFNDIAFVWWNDAGVETAHTYTITTHPGFRYLQKPANIDGAAILVPGQYIDCWVIRMHRNIQLALCQDAGMVAVYRDNNKDTALDMNPVTIQKGFFGIDLHHAAVTDNNVIGPWSAGCQVWRYHEPHEAMISSFQSLKTKYGFSKFSYTLLKQEDF
jgi:hypothetical protein